MVLVGYKECTSGQQKSSHHPFWLEFIDFRLIEAEERKADGSSVVVVGCNL